MKNVTLSVILPVAGYNTRWLDQAVQSAIPFADEIIVVADWWAGKICHDKPWMEDVFFIQIDLPSGPEAAINAGIAVASGTHYSVLCSDDFYLPGFADVKIAAEKSGADVCYGRVVFSGMLSGRWPEAGLLANLDFQNCIPNAAIVRREWWYRAGGYRNVRYSDWDYWKRLKKCKNEHGEPSKFEFFPADFYHYRAWEGTISARYGYRSDLGHEWDAPKTPLAAD